ncbi:hypothetical protein P8452_07433 [Trifolium repens]|nr:hypothetical protein P8452_07433 [Trifolium repens]
MDSSYRKELQNALGEQVVVTLPQVFIREKHVGNAEENKLLNESGELENLLKDFPIKDSWLECESCGDARFVPCSNCNGRFKISSKYIYLSCTPSKDNQQMRYLHIVCFS